jgi:hypothetical protein
MALSYQLQVGKAIRRDRDVHGLTICQVNIVMSAGSGTDYPAGGIVVAPVSIGLRSIYTVLAISGVLGNGTTQDLDCVWDFVNGKLKIFLMTGVEITSTITAGGSVRVTFMGV